MASQIPFTRGVPSADLLPIDELRVAVTRALQDEPAVALSYSTGAGHAGLRKWIGERHGVGADRVVTTNGSLQALLFAGELLIGDGGRKRVLVEAPTYDRAILLLRRAHGDVHGIPVDEHGLDVDALADDIRIHGVPSLVYVIPNFQNPSGATLSLERRHQLIALSREHGFTIIEDDPYGLLRWRGEDLPTLLALGGEGVISMSSFTKTVAPGLRIGYAILPPALAARMTKHANETYISPSMVSQSALAAYVAAGSFEPWVEQAKAELERRCDAMCDAVDAHFPRGSHYVRPDGGYFLWVDGPEGVDATRLLDEATAAGVPYVKGADFFAEPAGERSFRLAFSAVPPEQIREGIQRLGGIVSGALATA
jgi:DNA-binding transcriptional MocR family regulator